MKVLFFSEEAAKVGLPLDERLLNARQRESLERKRQVLTLLLQGKSWREIEQTLSIAHTTVARIAKEIYSVYGVVSRVDLLAQFYWAAKESNPTFP